MRPMLCLLLAIAAAPAHARTPFAPAAQPLAGRSWGPEQAIGAPDVPAAGDNAAAWATLQADGGVEWLELSYGDAVTITRLHIFETFNPGAVSRVTAWEGGEEVEIWSGDVRTDDAFRELVVKPTRSVRSNRVRIYIDTLRRAGWNEIDAVRLVGADGSKQWAQSATASSSYADGSAWGGDPFVPLVGKKVTLRLREQLTVSGVLRGSTGDFLTLEDGARTFLVAKAGLLTVEYK